MPDHPFNEVAALAEEAVAAGATVHQKWTCAHCGARQTMEEANTFFKAGKCEECGEVTVIAKCNFLLIFGLP